MLYAARPPSTAAATPSPLISNSRFTQTGRAGLNAAQACLMLVCVESHLRKLSVGACLFIEEGGMTQTPFMVT